MNVVSFCHFLQGPACTQYLADMGAKVIKIEPPSGPFERRWSGANAFVGGVSAFFLAANRNKRSLAVDLKSPEGREVVLKLIERADVLVENFRSGVMEKLGLSYEDVRQRKPDIIYASGTGWGVEGPMVERVAQDLIIQARCGLVHATGPARRPTTIGAAIVDQHGGALLAMGILAAYVGRLRTGNGVHVQGSLLNLGLDLQTEPLTNYLSKRPGRDVFDRQDNLVSWFHEAPYGVYRLKDRFVVIPTNDIGTIADALDSPRLRALAVFDRYDHRNEIAAAVAEEVSGLTLDEVTRAFDARGVWYGVVQDYDEVASDPQMAANACFRQVEVNGELAWLVNHPLRYDGRIPELHTLSMEPGSHTIEILRELGYPDADVRRLLDVGAVHTSECAIASAAE